MSAIKVKLVTRTLKARAAPNCDVWQACALA